MKNWLKILTGSMLISLMSSTSVFADTDGKQVKVKELANGNTVTIKRRGKIDDEGNIYKHRGFKVEDGNGDLVRRGSDKNIKFADGGQKRKQVREIHKDDGTVVQKRRRGMTDGEGNQRGQAQRRKIDTDGNVVARQRAKGKNNADGSKVRYKQTQKKRANGGLAEKKVYKKKTPDGRRTRVVKQRRKGG